MSKATTPVKAQLDESTTEVKQQLDDSPMVDYDVFQVRPRKVQKEDKRTRQQWTEIEGFEMFRKKKTVRIEAHVADDLNAFAEGIPTNNDFGELFLPMGKYKDGDFVTFLDVYPNKTAEDNMYRVIPQAQ